MPRPANREKIGKGQASRNTHLSGEVAGLPVGMEAMKNLNSKIGGERDGR